MRGSTPSASAKLAGNKLETTVEPDGKYVYYGNTDYYMMHFTRIR